MCIRDSPKPVAPLPKKAPVAVTKEVVKPVTAETAPVEGKKLNLEQVKKHYGTGKVVFVDARPEYAYVELHIKGAISLSASRFNLQFEAVKDKLDKKALYIIYCSSPTCHLSDLVAEDLAENDFKNIKIFTGGWDEWREAGYPVAGLKVKGTVSGED